MVGVDYAQIYVISADALTGVGESAPPAVPARDNDKGYLTGETVW